MIFTRTKDRTDQPHNFWYSTVSHYEKQNLKEYDKLYLMYIL